MWIQQAAGDVERKTARGATIVAMRAQSSKRAESRMCNSRQGLSKEPWLHPCGLLGEYATIGRSSMVHQSAIMAVPTMPRVSWSSL